VTPEEMEKVKASIKERKRAARELARQKLYAAKLAAHRAGDAQQLKSLMKTKLEKFMPPAVRMKDVRSVVRPYKHRTHSAAKKRQAREMMRDDVVARYMRGGISLRKLAEETGLTFATVAQWVRKYKIANDIPFDQTLNPKTDYKARAFKRRMKKFYKRAGVF